MSLRNCTKRRIYYYHNYVSWYITDDDIVCWCLREIKVKLKCATIAQKFHYSMDLLESLEIKNVNNTAKKQQQYYAIYHVESNNKFKRYTIYVFKM